MNNTALEQEQLFNDIITMKHRIQNLGSYVQNDFDRMLADGTVTRDYICESICEMAKDYTKFRTDLSKLEVKARRLMSSKLFTDNDDVDAINFH